MVTGLVTATLVTVSRFRKTSVSMETGLETAALETNSSVRTWLRTSFMRTVDSGAGQEACFVFSPLFSPRRLGRPKCKTRHLGRVGS